MSYIISRAVLLTELISWSGFSVVPFRMAGAVFGYSHQRQGQILRRALLIFSPTNDVNTLMV